MQKTFLYIISILLLAVSACRSEAVRARNELIGKYSVAITYTNPGIPIFTEVDTFEFFKNKGNRKEVDLGKGIILEYIGNDTFATKEHLWKFYILNENNIDMLYYSYISPSQLILSAYGTGVKIP